MTDFPSSKYERSKIFAKTGFKVGTNYAKHYMKESLSGRGRKKGTGKQHSNIGNLHRENAQYIFDEFSKLRGTALKIAQSLSMDQSMMPEEFADVLSQAQYQVPPINKALVRNIISQELGDAPENIFKSFEPEAFAAASIGQVHRAVTRDGQKVVVKIQYPNVRETINSDLNMAKMVMGRIIHNDDIEPYVAEVRERLMEETDYHHEGRQIESFRARFPSERYLIPRWHSSLSTDRVLTMSYIEGKHLNAFLEEEPSQKLRDHYGQMLWDFFHQQIDQDFPVHADTHPGNFVFVEDGRLGVLDFGCTKSFPDEFFYNYLKLLPVHLRNEVAELKQLYQDMGVYHPDAKNSSKEESFFQFSRKVGVAYAQPYKDEYFDFSDPDYKKQIRELSEDIPVMLEARGSRHFIYSTRVHFGLYNFLMKLGAKVHTRPSLERVKKVLGETG